MVQGAFETRRVREVCAVVGTTEVFQEHGVFSFSLTSRKCPEVPLIGPDVKHTEVS